jgi:copper(I)-binding protein
MKHATTALAAFAALVGASTASLAETYTLGDLVIENPAARATPPNAPVSGGYMVIRNNGDEPDRLIGGAADFAGKVEIHEMAMEGDVMKMRQLEDGLEVPAHGEVTLKPGGFHVMFMQMKDQLQPDTTRTVTLRFEKAGEIDVDVDVLDPAKLQMQMKMQMK